MKTLIKKDLRENLVVAAIGLLVFALLLVQAFESSTSALDNLLLNSWSVQSVTLQPLLANTLVIESAFFCALFGAVLGWFQTRNEAHRDLWAFLIHRPVTRTEIFLGKTIAGLCLYGLGAGLPLAGLVLVARLPGHVAAPFEWPMALPLVELFLGGVAGYFAGQLTGLRQARWYVSRGWGLGLAIFALISVFGYEDCWKSWATLALAIGVLALAAWGAYQSGGLYDGQPLPAKWGLIAALTVGCVLVMYAVVGLLVVLFLSPLTRTPYAYSSYVMTRDGTIYKTTSHGGKTDTIEDLAGHPLTDPKTGRKLEYKEFQPRLAYGPSIFNRFGAKSIGNPLRNGAAFFTLWSISDKTLWYLDRHGKLVGFDGRTRKYVGAIEAPGDPFLPGGNYGYYYSAYNDTPRNFIPTATTVYRVDFEERSLKPVLTLTNDEIGGYESQQQNYGTIETPDSVFIGQDFFFSTRQAVYFLDKTGNVVFKTPYGPGFAQYPRVVLSQLKSKESMTNRFAVWFYPDYEQNSHAGWKLPVQVEWLGTNGLGVIKTMDLPTLYHDSPPDWSDKLAEVFVAPAAALPEMAYRHFQHESAGYPHREGLPLAVLSAIATWLLVRRYHFPTAAAAGWTVFALLFGLFGLLVLICAQEWPARETCPSCQRRRMVNRENCEHCAAPFPPPERNGTEIFDLLTKV
jgi:hypothetical protein